jgi:hypothetical protein
LPSNGISAVGEGDATISESAGVSVGVSVGVSDWATPNQELKHATPRHASRPGRREKRIEDTVG